MGLFARRPTRITTEPTWGGPPSPGPVRFDPTVTTAAELVGQPPADLRIGAPQVQATVAADSGHEKHVAA